MKLVLIMMALFSMRLPIHIPLVGIGDAVKGIETPVVEVHISNVHATRRI